MSGTRTINMRAALVLAFAALALLVTGVGRADAKSLKLKGDDTALTLNADTAKALTDAGYTVAPVGAAQARADGSIAFPITGGRVNAKTLAGYITHSGGLSLTNGHKTVVVQRFTIRTDRGKPFLSARAGKARLRLLNLSDIKRTDAGGKVVVTAKATLAKPAAKALNAAFGTSLFKAGLPIGTAKVTASA